MAANLHRHTGSGWQISSDTFCWILQITDKLHTGKVNMRRQAFAVGESEVSSKEHPSASRL